MTGPRSSRARRWLAAWTALVLVAIGALIPVASVSAVAPTNMVLTWNENAVNVLSQPATNTPPGLGQAPPLSPLNLAMVHGAIYDAVMAIEGGHEPYLGELNAESDALVDAAVAQAGHDVLYGLTASTNLAVRDRIDAMLTASLLLVPDGDGEDHGRDVGTAAAAAMLDARGNFTVPGLDAWTPTDGRSDSEPWVAGSGVGQWRTVGPLGPPANNAFGQFATVTPLTLNAPDQYLTAGPLDVMSDQYVAEFNEVKALGAQEGSTRTEEQTLTAGFFSANPIFFYNSGLRGIAADEELSTSDQARLFVMTSMASADALIGCWANKDVWMAWRPQTAIREAANDGNPLTEPDEDWLSLFATPGYPDEPSGYNCYTGGFWQSVRFFFGTDKYSFSLTSPGVPANANVPPGNPVGVRGSTKDFKRFTDVIDGTINGRILNGFHFRTADVQGAWLGKKVAQWVDKHYFGPVD